jgi:sugar lactone lactonase YvrE
VAGLAAAPTISEAVAVSVAAVPEPSTWCLALAGLSFTVLSSRRRRRIISRFSFLRSILMCKMSLRRCGSILLLACLVLPRLSAAGTLYVADRINNTVSSYNSTTGALINASFITGLNNPWGLTRDSDGNFYVANRSSNTIGKYGPDGTAINASFITGLSEATAVAVDGSGRLFVSSGNIRTYDATTGTLISGSFVTGLNSPRGVAFDGAGNMYVADYFNARVGKYNATTGATVNASLITDVSTPVNMAFDATGKLYVATFGNLGVGVYNATTGVTITAPLASGLNGTWGIAFDESNDLFVSRYSFGALAKFTAAGATISNPFATLAALGPTSLVYVVPEPSTYAMALAGLAAGGFMIRRSRQRRGGAAL